MNPQIQVRMRPIVLLQRSNQERLEDALAAWERDWRAAHSKPARNDLLRIAIGAAVIVWVIILIVMLAW